MVGYNDDILIRFLLHYIHFSISENWLKYANVLFIMLALCVRAARDWLGAGAPCMCPGQSMCIWCAFDGTSR